MPGTKGNKSDKKSATKQPPSPKDQPKKVDQKGDDNKKQGAGQPKGENFQAFVKMAMETLLGSCVVNMGVPGAGRAEVPSLSSSPFPYGPAERGCSQ